MLMLALRDPVWLENWLSTHELKAYLVGALNVTMPMGHESSEDASSRVLPVLLETARAMRNLI